jgi:hypothetical protein
LLVHREHVGQPSFRQRSAALCDYASGVR